ncbi:MAG: Maf family protein [Gammaproteobacteria bacterium]
MKNIILASSSVHRKKLLKQLKIKFKAISPNINESRKKNEPINAFVKRLSIEKAKKIANGQKNALVIGSDEIAIVNNRILGKPNNYVNARKQLKYISNKVVTFKTGLCVIDTESNKRLSTVINYTIHMKKISTSQIESYIKREKMLNCAASIRIEGLAISLVKKMNGADPSSIIGLPLIKLTEYLKRFDYDVLG